MTLRAPAFLGIWHDIDSAYETDWHRWHTFEHMPERAAVPGFTVGRRYTHASDAPQRCFTLYEAESLGTFTSPPYLARLNAPTEWTQRMMPSFQNLVRGACRVAGSAERTAGYGGAIRTVRLSQAPVHIDYPALANRLAGLDDVLAAHMGLCEHEATQSDTNEGSLRTQTSEQKFTAVELIEGIDSTRLEMISPAIDALISQSGCEIETGQTYALAYVLGQGLA